MGKKTQYKKLNSIIKELPKGIEEYIWKGKIKGQEIIDMGQTHIDKIKIDPDRSYYVKQTKLREINHRNRFKKFYLKYGIENCTEYYLEWLSDQNNKMAKKYPKLFKET